MVNVPRNSLFQERIFSWWKVKQALYLHAFTLSILLEMRLIFLVDIAAL